MANAHAGSSSHLTPHSLVPFGMPYQCSTFFHNSLACKGDSGACSIIVCSDCACGVPCTDDGGNS